MRNHLSPRPQTILLDYFISPQSEHRPLINHFTTQNLCDLISSAALFLAMRAPRQSFLGSVIEVQRIATVSPTRLYWFYVSMPISTLIVDDEKPARDDLAFLLKSFPEINLVGQGKNGLEAVNLIKEHSPDLVFLDVQMPGLDGFGVLKKLVERKARVPHVVFATALHHHDVQAFDVNAVDYVLKPFDKSRIAKAIARARREMEAETSPAERLEKLVSQLS